MEAVLPGRSRPSSKPRKRIADYVVVFENRVLFAAPTLSEAAGFRDGFGGGEIHQRRVERKAVRTC